ncbi:MAG: para-nitrobenzyl esterase [Candidatus Azotimanducaceae bacterium]|jgi:para-nitrobenzyl esterase
MNILLSVLLLLSCFHSALNAATNTTAIKLTQGTIVGTQSDGLTVFKGIPYAKPPVGQYRWQPPRSPEPEEKSLLAKEFGAMCLQANFRNTPKFDISEDCLSVNVWTPHTQAKQPVMVWIHGGGFRGGSNRIKGEVFANEGNVVVSVNYRLGPLGFFAHESLEQPVANFGLLDLELALQWVAENVHAFGGDPENVTIFGVSAGGQAINLLMTSPRARGLFHRAIAQSGYATWPLPRSRNAALPAPKNLYMAPANSAEEMDRKLIKSISLDDQTEAMLRAIDGKRLIQAQVGFRAPIVDGSSLMEEPGILFLRGEQAKVPFITGGASYEGSVVGAIPLTPADIERSLNEDLEFARNLYASDPEDIWQRRLQGDMRYLFSGRTTAKAMGASPVWLYYIDFLSVSQAGEPGTAHGSDGWLIFNGASSEDPEVRSLSSRIISYWSRFASTGNPNSGKSATWPTYDSNHKTWLIFDKFDRIGRAINKEKLDFHERRYHERISSDTEQSR